MMSPRLITPFDSPGIDVSNFDPLKNTAHLPYLTLNVSSQKFDFDEPVNFPKFDDSVDFPKFDDFPQIAPACEIIKSPSKKSQNKKKLKERVDKLEKEVLELKEIINKIISKTT